MQPIETAEQMRGAKTAVSDKRLMLVSWTLLLDRLAARSALLSDIVSDADRLLELSRRRGTYWTWTVRSVSGWRNRQNCLAFC